MRLAKLALAQAGLGSQVVDLAGDVEIDPLSLQRREAFAILADIADRASAAARSDFGFAS